MIGVLRRTRPNEHEQVEAEPEPASGAVPEPAVCALGGELRRGFVAMVPLWAGVVPFAVAFAVIAVGAGLSLIEIVALSAVLFAGSAQLAVVSMVSAGAGIGAVTVTVLLLNLRHVLYGISLRPYLPEKGSIPRPLLAFVLTDEAYGVAMHAYQQSRWSEAFLLGAGLSLYVVFNLATVVGALMGAALPDPKSLGLDFIFPLSFLALLFPLLHTRRHVAVAGVAGGLALTAGRVAGSGPTIVLATVLAAGLGVLLDARARRAPR